MSKTINLGAVTAYADAVAAGYTGTREQFAQDLANAATYAAESHANAEAASDAAETATAAASAASLDADAAHDDATTAHSDAEAALSFKAAAENAAGTATTKAGEAANSASQAATSASGAAGSATAASGSATAAAGSATDAAASETAAAGSATAAAGSASAAAQTLVDVNTAGATQVAAIAAKGAEVLESIPADYTTLSNDVDDLKSDLTQLLNPVNLTGWESGGYNTTNGEDYVSPTYIRNRSFVSVADGTMHITCDNGYLMLLYAWNISDGSFVGSLKTSGVFDTTTSNYRLVTDFDCKKYPLYKFKITMRFEPASESITPDDGTHCYLHNTTDKTLTKANKAADSKKVGDELTTLQNEFDAITHYSQNLLDKSTITRNAYIAPTGLQTASAYAGWFASDYIMVNGAAKLQANFLVASIIIYNVDGSVDTTNSYNGLHTAVALPYTLPATAYRIRVSGWMSAIDRDLMLNFGEMALPYEPYGEMFLLPDKVEDALRENPVEAKVNSLSTSGDYLTAGKQALKKNVVTTFSANFTAFTSLLIGFTKTNDYATGYTDYLEITSTAFILHRLNQTDITWEHGLTIKDYIGVEITFNFAMNFTAKITTNGGVYTKSNYFYLGASYYPFAIITGTNVTNRKLSLSCKDFRRNIMMFGDSYFSNSSSRWTYYLSEAELANLCINGYAGESSASAITDFDTLIKLGSPKFILWCLGMNDGSDPDDATPSSAWLTVVEHVLSVCASKNITPVLATIPSVPTINNRGKSAYVRASGYPYIDFAAAVNSDNQGNWYTGLLSNDGVHPSEDGAKVLFARAITDFPDLLINN